MTASMAINLLLERFPMLLKQVDSPDDLQTAQPYLAFSLLATETLENCSDKSFLDSVCKFITELSESGDPLLEEVLVVSILERIAENPTVAKKLKQCIGDKAQYWLSRVEKEMFGR